MITLAALALLPAAIAAAGALVVKFAAEDRPGFSERVPLS